MAAFLTVRRLGLGDCDRSGIAYFPSYIGMLASVVEEMFGQIGAPYGVLMGELGIGVPTVRLEVTFEKPGFLDDVLQWELKVVRIGTSSAELGHRVQAGGRGLWAARQVIVATALGDLAPIPWPASLRAGLARYMETLDATGPAA